MKKFYRIFLLITILVFLSTYNPNKFEANIENNNTFFQIKKIILLTKKKFSTKDLSILLSIIYKIPKKFFYTKLIKISDNKKN